MLSEVVTCNCVRNPGGHAELNPRPSKEGVSFYHVLRPLDHCVARRKQHQPGITPNDNTTHVPTAGSSAAPTKPSHTPTRHPRAKGKLDNCVLICFSTPCKLNPAEPLDTSGTCYILHPLSKPTASTNPLPLPPPLPLSPPCVCRSPQVYRDGAAPGMVCISANAVCCLLWIACQVHGAHVQGYSAGGCSAVESSSCVQVMICKQSRSPPPPLAVPTSPSAATRPPSLVGGGWG